MFKGSAEPVKVFELLAHTGGGLVTSDDQRRERLIGRVEEVAVLSEAMMSARLGRGMIVQLTASAGMGKSRLIAAALASAGTTDLEVLTGAAQSYACLL